MTAHTADSARAARRVFVVDDDLDTCESLAILLHMHGFESRSVTSVERFLAEAPGFAPDAVLLDLRMPGCDGYAALRLFRGLPALANVPVIAVSGYAREVDRRQTLSAGFAGHVAKPFEVDALVALLDAVIGGR